MDEKVPPPSPEKQEEMLERGRVSRRTFMMNVGIALNAIAGIAIATPVVAYLLGPVLKEKNYRKWIAIGDVTEFQPGQTKLVNFRNPYTESWDGVTANVPAYVRCTGPVTETGSFVVFAVNCAHLGCPVRWFSESQLFMCPCHGGVYYADGSRASGPPERGLFTYDAKIENSQLMIDAGQMPTLSNRASAVPCPGSTNAVQEASNAAPTSLVRIGPWPGTKTPTIG